MNERTLEYLIDTICKIDKIVGNPGHSAKLAEIRILTRVTITQLKEEGRIKENE